MFIYLIQIVEEDEGSKKVEVLELPQSADVTHSKVLSCHAFSPSDLWY